jgi:hypothetical protein
MTAKLRLGPVPKATPVKLTLTLSAELKATLDRYAEVHSQSTGEQNNVERLIPFMLEAFMASDRGFRSSRRSSSRDKADGARDRDPT